MEFYQNFLVKVLGDKINSKLPADRHIDAANIAEVMANINVLTQKVDKLEFGEPCGEFFTYLPKEDKVSIMRLISMTSALSSEVAWEKVNTKGDVVMRNEVGNYVLKGSAKLYFDRNDTRPIATYQKTYELDRILPDGVTYETATIEQRSNAEGLVRGIVETRCLSKFGIGEWFGNDNDPESMLAQNDNYSFSVVTPPVTENAPVDVISTDSNSTQMELAFDIVVPTPEVPSETPVAEEAAPVKKTRKKTPKTEDAPAENTETINKEEPTAIIPKPSDAEISDAMNVKATVGIAATKGLTLGDIAKDERMKVASLKYIYIHSHNHQEKAAIKVLANSDEQIMESFTREGISLS